MTFACHRGTKADEYARDEPHGYYEGVFALLLCRAPWLSLTCSSVEVALGKFFYTTERCEQAGEKVKSGDYDSTVGDRSLPIRFQIRFAVRTKKANTFREFVVYNSDQVAFLFLNEEILRCIPSM